ncbi:hypothetical protein [Robinsoniella peoriensis]
MAGMNFITRSSACFTLITFSLH